MTKWSEIPKYRLKAELAKLGIDEQILILDVQDVPELRTSTEGKTDDELLALALRWFGDEGHPQPTERSTWIKDERTQRYVRKEVA